MIIRIIRINVNAHVDRDRMVLALANSGYSVWVEYENQFTSKAKYYVCFNYEGDKNV